MSQIIDQVDTPALLLEENILQENIRQMQLLAEKHSVRLRPHIKTHKSAFLAKKQLEAGAAGITAAKLSEAEVMAAHGFDDIFVANQIVGAIKIERMFQLSKAITISCAVDSAANAGELSSRFAAGHSVLDVLVEFNSGLDRCGLGNADNILALAKQIKALPGLRMKGLMTHPGQVYKVSSPAEINNIAEQSSRLLVDLARQLRQGGIQCPVVSAGCTPGAASAIGVPGITEFRPGNYIFNDMMQVGLGQCGINNCALSILATVISVPSSNRAAIDAGSKVFGLDEAADAGSTINSFGHIVGKQATLARLSEEHGVIEHDGETFAIGERLRIIPNHACPVMNLFDIAYLVDGEQVLASLPVEARGKVT